MDNMSESFKNVVKTLFNNWSGLHLAVEHGMGGRHGQKIALDIVNYVYEYCIQNENITNTELEDLLEELMDQELNTVCEDNSVAEISSQLLKYLELCKQGKFSDIEIQLNQLPQKSNWLDTNTPIKIIKNDDDDDDSSSEESNDQDDEDNNKNGNEQMDVDIQNETSNNVEDEVEPGWTLVKTKHKR